MTHLLTHNCNSGERPRLTESFQTMVQSLFRARRGRVIQLIRNAFVSAFDLDTLAAESDDDDDFINAVLTPISRSVDRNHLTNPPPPGIIS